MDWRNRIVIDPTLPVPRPVIRGTQVPVESIVGLLAEGWSHAQVIDSYPYISEQDISACLAYAGELLRDDSASRAKINARIPPKVSMDPMKVALRVLTALAEKQTPALPDIEALMRLIGPKSSETGLDEFACEALQKIMRDRADARKSLTVG